MYSGVFNMLHYCGDKSVLTVGEGISLRFNGIFDELIHETRRVGGYSHSVNHIFLKHILIEDYLHGSSSEDI